MGSCMSLDKSVSENTQNGEDYTSEIEDIDKEDDTKSVSDKSTSTITEKINKKDFSVATFDKMIETLYDAGVKAQRSVQLSNLHHLEKYFEDTDGDGILEPKVIRIKVPSSNENEDWEIIEVPLFTLVNHNNLKIENLQVKFKINLDDMVVKSFNTKKDKQLKTNCGKGIYKKIFKKKWKLKINKPIQQNVNCAEVCVDFKYDDTLESIVRLSERYSRLI